MDSPDVRLTYLHTYTRVEKTLKQLQHNPPEVIFVEKKLIAHREQSGLRSLLEYIDAHYQRTSEGRYLAAYRRKN